MLRLLALHDIAAKRGDGLRPEFLGALPEKPLSERTSLTLSEMVESNQQSPLIDNATPLTYGVVLAIKD